MDRKQEILKAAAKTFSLYGFKATSVDQIARQAGVGKGTIYTFFSTKEELFQAIVLSTIEEMKLEADRILDTQASPTENAHVALMKMLEFRETHQLLARLIEEERTTHAKAVREMMQQVERAIVEFIEDRLTRALPNLQNDPKLVAYLLYKSYVAFVLEWNQLYDQPLDEETISRFFQKSLFKGLLQ